MLKSTGPLALGVFAALKRTLFGGAMLVLPLVLVGVDAVGVLLVLLLDVPLPNRPLVVDAVPVPPKSDPEEVGVLPKVKPVGFPLLLAMLAISYCHRRGQ